MITYGFQYDVKAEKREEFISISNGALTVMNTMKGHVMTKLFEDVNSKNSFMIYSEWETNEAFKVFMNSKEFKEVQIASRDMLTTQPKHKMYETKEMGR